MISQSSHSSDEVLSEASTSFSPTDSVLGSQHGSENETLTDEDYLSLLDSQTSSLRRRLLASAYPEYFSVSHAQNLVQNVESHDQSDHKATTRPKTTRSAVPRCSSSSNTQTRSMPKRNRGEKDDECDDNDEPHRKKQKTPAPLPKGSKKQKRLACLYHKHNTRLYRTSLQTQTRFEVCATHDFEDMHRLL